MPTTVTTDEVKLEPFWWEAAPRPTGVPTEVPERVDVAVVGSGYTGLSAALTLARGGANVAVFEAGVPGEGASSRNGGGFGHGLKVPFSELTRRIGLEPAKALFNEHAASRKHLIDFIRDEGIECHFVNRGRFTGAHAPAKYDSMARELAFEQKHLDMDAEMAPRSDQSSFVDTELYHGGLWTRFGGHLHPALYHQGLLDRALAAGAVIVPQTRVARIERAGAEFTLAAGNHTVKADNVIIATNGYSGPVNGWLRRRLIPIQSQMIATEPLDPAVVARLLPEQRMIGDTYQLKHYYRASPDGTRILFGGRAGGEELNDPKRSGVHLHRRLTRLFPELAGVGLTHSWAGFVAFSFDYLPHFGVQGGIHYALGYCGSGVMLSTYFGHKLGQRILGAPGAGSPFENRRFSTRPFYTGKPWFLSAVMAYYAWRDSRYI
ncbi:MAG: FAD-binding oxidoreductase [Rhodospirillales bacterium]|jgi:glycine/D-amino acid oxidase-like deaminating enzyme|nr:FAD-binding oxidoreductase [Rhodospirillales bacterium]MDP6883410.1 FAD-binding oxidoreductase [Rhodospirillales bacterium]